MQLPSQQDVEQLQTHIDLGLVTKCAGFVASGIGAIKFSVAFINDQSLRRKVANAASDIDMLLAQLAKLKCDPWIQHGGTLDSYQQHLEEDLNGTLNRLNDLKAEALMRAARRNAEPSGIRRWLLLYRPEGLDGLSMQSWFYFSLIIALFMLVISPFVSGYVILTIPIMVFWGGIAFWVRSIALRLKSVGNAVRLLCAAPPNGDLGGFRRTLVLWIHGQWISRMLFYGLFLLTVWLQIYALKYRSDHGPGEGISWQMLLFFTVVLLAVAEIFRADALSRRAKRRMFPKADLVTSGVAEAAPTG